MSFLYLDNFRGFKDTLIPILDVNFLVGENSTGKTSVLSLLKLLRTHQFWFNQEFETSGTSFGRFDDIVSINSLDRTYFSVGFIEDNSGENKKMKQIFNAFMMTFKKKEGMPKISNYCYNDGTREVRMRFSGNSINYKVSEFTSNVNIDDFITNVFKSWTIARKDNRGFRRLPKEFEFSGNPPLPFVSSVIEDLSRGKSNIRLSGIFRGPGFLGSELTWLAPIRTRPRRTYDEYRFEFSPEGEHTPYLIRKILDTKSEAESFQRFMKKIGKASGLFDSVSIKKYGRSATSPFELDIVLNRKALSMDSVGYGVSQALPLLVELFTRPKEAWFAIQQPEIHLHPKAQAAFGEIFFRFASNDNKKFLIETHSDYTIDRYRLNHGKQEKKPSAQILFFERTSEGNKIHPLKFSEKGELPSNQPKAYRNFFIKEELQLLDL